MLCFEQPQFLIILILQLKLLITLVVILKYKKQCLYYFNNFGSFSIRFRHAIQKVWSKDFIDFIFGEWTESNFLSLNSKLW